MSVPPEVQAIAAGHRGPAEARGKWVEANVAYLRRLGRRSADLDAAVRYIYAEAAVETKTAELVSTIVAVIVEVAKPAVIFKDCADLLWRAAERSLTPQNISAVQAPFARCVQLGPRSEERRVGKECSQQCRSRWSPYH